MPVAWLAFHFLVGFAGTWLARAYAVRWKLYDQPGERRSHGVATPRGGGIAIVASMFLALAFIGWGGDAPRQALACIATGLLLVAAIGWVDDHRPLSPWSRLLVHAIAAGLLAWATLILGGSVADAAFAFLAALVLVNVWNFMDGIDGLAASQAALVAAGYAMVTSGGAHWLALALVASACGFLPYNFPKARIFLGDVGSGALGYGLAGLMVAAAMANGGGAGTWLLVLLPVSVFLIDASLTLGARILRREKWWQPHVQHAYQRWARLAGNHRVVTVAYAMATLVTVLAMLGGRSSGTPFRIVMIAAVWLAGAACWHWLQRRCRVRNP